MTDSGSTLAGRQLGSYVRTARQELGFTQERAAATADISTSVLQRLERGIPTRLKSRDIQALCAVLEMSEEATTAMVGLLLKTNEKSWWHAYGDVIPASFDVYVGLESAAHRLTMYQPSIVPGLLQTPDYAGALIRDAYPAASQEDRAKLLDLRIRRQVQLTRRHRPLEVRVVLHEAALRCRVGDTKVMVDQLKHLAEIGKRPNVSLCVLPFDAGMPLGHPIGQYAILEFEETASPSIVYLDALTGSIYLEKADEVARYENATQRLRRHTFDEDASRMLIRRIVKEYEGG